MVHQEYHANEHVNGEDDIRNFGGAGVKGLVPDPESETGKFLKDDGTWDNPSSSGFPPQIIDGGGHSTTSGIYATAKQFPFLGTAKIGTPTKIKMVCKVTDSGSIKIYDSTNSLTIVEKNGITNTGYIIIDLGTLSNLPAGEAVFEVQIKNDGAGADVIYVYGGSIE